MANEFDVFFGIKQSAVGDFNEVCHVSRRVLRVPPQWPHAPSLSVFDAGSDRFDHLKSIEPVKNVLIAVYVLNNEFGFPIDG